MNQIDISNVGPIEAVSIPIPADGGVVVLRGPNGTGKSIALSAVDAITREGRAVPKARARDGSLGGSVEGLGRTIKVGLQRSTVRGELEVSAIGDDVDVAALVDPGLKDPAAADRQRIKSALLLARVKVEVEAFGELVGGMKRLTELVRADALAATDPVEMAERIRRDLHNGALQREREADAREASAKGLREAVAEIGEDTLDEAAIRAEAEDAVAGKRELEQRRAIAVDTTAKRAAAEAVLAETSDGPTVNEASAALDSAEAEVTTADAECQAARLALEAAEGRLTLARANVKSSAAALVAARRHTEAITKARAALDGLAAVTAPTEEEWAVVTARVEAAHAATEQIGVLREAQKRRDEADRAAADAKRIQSEAAELRGAAKATDDVLAALLASFAPAGLTIHDGRLVVERDGRQKFFADLSDGERWKLSLDLAIDALGDARILAISQLAWEGLDADARAAINAHAKERSTVIVTAEADHQQVGALRAEAFE